MAKLWRHAVVIAVGIAGGLLGCGDKAPMRSPLQPSDSLNSLTIEGPVSVPPGMTAKYYVTAHFAGGSTRDVTQEAVWYSNSSLLTVDRGDGWLRWDMSLVHRTRYQQEAEPFRTRRTV